jgi:hypothetical protein
MDANTAATKSGLVFPLTAFQSVGFPSKDAPSRMGNNRRAPSVQPTNRVPCEYSRHVMATPTDTALTLMRLPRREGRMIAYRSKIQRTKTSLPVPWSIEQPRTDLHHVEQVPYELLPWYHRHGLAKQQSFRQNSQCKWQVQFQVHVRPSRHTMVESASKSSARGSRLMDNSFAG